MPYEYQIRGFWSLSKGLKKWVPAFYNIPMPCRYFSVVGGGNDLVWEELESQRGQYVLAHNGWVMNADPLVNFAAEGTTVSS